jgi:hypothetical protein
LSEQVDDFLEECIREIGDERTTVSEEEEKRLFDERIDECGEGTSRPDLTVKTEVRPNTPTMVASQGKEPKFAQIYHHDPDDMDRQLENRRKLLATEYWVKMF